MLQPTSTVIGITQLGSTPAAPYTTRLPVGMPIPCAPRSLCLFMCTNVHVCMCVHMCVCVRVSIACGNAYPVCPKVPVFIYVYKCACVNVHVYVCMCVCMRVCVCVSIACDLALSAPRFLCELVCVCVCACMFAGMCACEHIRVCACKRAEHTEDDSDQKTTASKKVALERQRSGKVPFR